MASNAGSETVLRDLYPTGGYDAGIDTYGERRGSQMYEHNHTIQDYLPAVDGGREAWLFLAGSEFPGA